MHSNDLWKETLTTLQEGNVQLRVRWRFEAGTLHGFVVQLEHEVDGHWRAVVRYDTSHGQPHRDVLNRDGDVVEKTWLDMANNAAMAYAMNDVRQNWQGHVKGWLKR